MCVFMYWIQYCLCWYVFYFGESPPPRHIFGSTEPPSQQLAITDCLAPLPSLKHRRDMLSSPWRYLSVQWQSVCPSPRFKRLQEYFQRPEHWSVQNVQVWAWAKNLDIDSGIDIAPLGVLLTFLLTRLGVVKENIRLRLSLPYNYIGGKPIWSGCSTRFRV
jgi:hypothetical protein